MASLGSAFTTTPWTIVNAAQAEVEPAQIRAQVAKLCRIYWPAVYAYLRRTGKNASDAEEITQGFFSDVVLQRNLFLRASKQQGRLRSWLLRSLKNYQIDLGRRELRSANAIPISAEDVAELEANLRAIADRTPARTFDYQWATEVLNEGLRQTERHFVKTGQLVKWRVFEEQVLSPIRSGNKPIRQILTAQEFGLGSGSAVANACHSVRQHLRLRIETVVAEISAPGQHRGELNYLLDQLAAEA